MSEMPVAEFWEKQLLGKPPLLLLPTDKPRTSAASSLFQVPLTLSRGLVSKLETIGGKVLAHLSGSQKGSALWPTLAAFQILLSRYSRQDDITIGVPSTHSGKELLPLRVDLEGNPTFDKLVITNAQTANLISQYSQVSLAQLAQAVAAKSFDFSLGLHPVFQGAFILNGSEDVRRLGQGYNLDILLELREVDGSLQGHLCGKETFFTVQTIERMVKHFQNLLAVVAKAADFPINSLDFVDEAEREVVLEKFNATATELPSPYKDATIHGLFEHWASQTPNARAISFEGKYLTYKQLDSRSNQLARFLEANGVKPEQPVGVMLERSLELMIAMMAVLKAGGAFVPMDPEYPADRLAIMAEDAEVPVLLSLSRIDAYIPLPATAQRVNLDTDWHRISTYPAEGPAVSRSHANGLAYIIFTSGSTGRPKGTLLQHSGLINYLYYLISEHDLGAKDVFLQKTPISFDVSVRELFFPFSVGAELVFAIPGGHRDTQYLAELIAARGITCCSFVPSQLEIFLQEVDGSACRALRRVFVSGEALPPTSVAKFIEVLPDAQLHNLYGPTEATVDVTGYDVRQHKGRATVPIGYPIANVKMYVLDSQLRPLPVGVPGELMISSLQLARGYIKRPDLTAEKFINCPFGEGDYGKMYRTGDLARWLPEGVIEFLGRLDYQVKLRGFRIELGEIENGLCNCPGIRQAVVVVVKDHAGTSHLVAYVTPDMVDVPAAVRALSALVPEYMVPEIIMPLKALPSLPNGKVNRRALPEPDFSATAQIDYIPPRNGLEEEIQYAWHEVFQLQPISVDADFFRIGGNSLLAGKIISRLRSAFSVELPFTSIFQHRTIGDMALFIQAKLQQNPAGTGPGPATDEIAIPVMYTEKERVGSTPCSYSQELLLFNNELDPFNPVHNEAAWVRIHGDLDVGALVRATRYLVDRHTVLSSHLAVAGVKGPMLKQIKPAKFKLPLSYVDLNTREELHVPEVLWRANSQKLVNVPTKNAKRKARLRTLKTAHAPKPAKGVKSSPQLEKVISLESRRSGVLLDDRRASAGVPLDVRRASVEIHLDDRRGPAGVPLEDRRGSAGTSLEDRRTSARDNAHVTLPRAATRNLAQHVEQFHANSNSAEDSEALSRLRTWLRSGIQPQDSVNAGLDEPQLSAVSSSHSSLDNLDLTSSNGHQNGRSRLPGRKEELHIIRSGTSADTDIDGKPLLYENGSAAQPQRLSTDLRPAQTPSKPPHSKANQGCFGSPPQETPELSAPSYRVMSTRSMSFRGRSLDLDQPPKMDAVKEVEAIAWRVKKSLLLHWLTCGIYSTRQSGGTQGFWKGAKHKFNTLIGVPEAAPRRQLKEEVEDEGGIMIPELGTNRSGGATVLRNLLIEEASKPFKIMQGPLLRVKLVRVNENEHVYLLTMHHSVTDGWSTGIIWKELSAAYNAFHRGQINVGLDPLPIQYADFATWQRHWLGHGVMNEQLMFWRQHLETTRPIWDFPTDFIRPAIPSGNSARVPISLKPEAVEAMKSLLGQVNATMFMGLLAVYTVLLARYSSVESITCGLPHAGRNRAETEGLIGAFLGAVALHADLQGMPSFRQVMQRVRKAALEVFENADVPIHLVITDVLGLGNVGGCAAPPLFQTMFFLHDSSWLEGLNLEGLRADFPAKVEKNVARFDLTLEMTMDAAKNSIAGHIEYRTDLFRRSTVENLVKHFEVLLDGIIAKPDSSIWDLPFLTSEDKSILNGARGVPSHLIPSNASAKTAKPKILSSKGYQLPPDIPGILQITYSPVTRRGLDKEGISFARHGSLMNMISGGFGLKKFFEDLPGDRAQQASPNTIELSSLKDTQPQVYEISSLNQGSAPVSPFGDPAPESSPTKPSVNKNLEDNAPLGISQRRSFRSDQQLEQTVTTSLLGKINREGRLEIIGHLNNRVDIGGVVTQLEDIDRQIKAKYPKVERATTVLQFDPEGLERLVAYISPANVNVVELEDTLRDYLPSLLVPYLFQALPRLPLTQSGEVDRRALPAPMWDQKVSQPYLPPQSRLEMEVQLIWVAVMNKKEMISCNADFSEIGGNMMHAVIANGIVREALGVQMPAINIFRDRTIVNVAERIRQTRRRRKGHKHVRSTSIAD